jgi:hypothetical protein
VLATFQSPVPACGKSSGKSAGTGTRDWQVPGTRRQESRRYYSPIHPPMNRAQSRQIQPDRAKSYCLSRIDRAERCSALRGMPSFCAACAFLRPVSLFWIRVHSRLFAVEVFGFRPFHPPQSYGGQASLPLRFRAPCGVNPYSSPAYSC